MVHSTTIFATMEFSTLFDTGRKTAMAWVDDFDSIRAFKLQP